MVDSALDRTGIELERVDTTAALRRYKVRIDGRPSGTLAQGQTLFIDVSPGSHTLQVRIDWVRSPAVNVQVEIGETARFVCRLLRGRRGRPLWRALLTSGFVIEVERR